ncbi:MAG TPA: glucosaminidase domain-containing protein [Saprospiraceae bacterium]|nr:glucosaminidase domain-containing protein [Saprospiraceae bacterium]
MNRFLYFLILVFILLALTESIANDVTKSYINNYKDIAVMEMYRTGIPASIKLAQALIESDWGRSDLALKANNHFGIKCGGKWEGQTYFKKDDDFDHKGSLIESCFRVFTNPIESFKNHSEFLTDPSKSNRYGFLFSYKSTDYVSWAHGLQTAGYATDQKYPKKLIEVIEKYKLYELDQEINNNSLADILTAPIDSKVLNPKLLNNNSTTPAKVKINYTINLAELKTDMTAAELAKLHNISLRDFLSYNEIVSLPNDILKSGSIIYLENKNRDYTGEDKTYIIKEGETIEYVAHIYGVRARTLKALNKIKKGEVIKPNTEILLKKK